MVRVYVIGIFLFFLIFLPGGVYPQISQGGVPMETKELKSSRFSIVEMPVAEIEKSMRLAVTDSIEGMPLKPFRFAHPFEVNLSPDNSGEWFEAGNGYRCWKLIIRSKGAKSINLIFNRFNLPENARLFIFNDQKVLGAYTSANNKQSGKFAVSPIEGDELTIQYEVSTLNSVLPPFEVVRVNHDYIGILKAGDRRPMGITAGACNVDINCAIAKDWNEVKNAVCRMIVHGVEVCTGVLINNTEKNGLPYILSAAHCYDRKEYAETTVYVFNYESPFCAPLDGDPSNSVSGALMKAQFDSLDFALTELSIIPPPGFRPYYAGWDRSGNLPDSTAAIHHPQGDIKKIAIDKDKPEISSFNSDYKKDGFLKIGRWDAGVTEAGSSGGPLFNPQKQAIGTLTGGVATCRDPVKDYFARFDLAWDYQADSSKQLKHWLDPVKSGQMQLDGANFNADENLCGAFTNLSDTDGYSLVSIRNNGVFQGYWGGSNSVGITEFMERFSVRGNEQLSGISIGVGKIKASGLKGNSEITVKVYNGNQLPEQLLYSQKIEIKNLTVGAMNFIGFSETVEPADNFFVGFELSNLQPLDTFVVYQSLRESSNQPNSFYLKQNQNWLKFNDANPDKKSMANIFELVACNIDNIMVDTPLINHPMHMVLFPNPANSSFVLEAGQDIPDNSISVFNLLGQKVKANVVKIRSRKVEVDLNGNIPGVYVVRFHYGDGFITQKVSYVPW